MTDAVVRVAHGLAAAEATTWSGMFQRALPLPYWTRRKRREIEDQHDRDGLLSWPVPFALNQDPAPLRAAPGPRSEWFAFQVALLPASGGRYDPAAAVAAWRALADDPEPPRLTIGQRAALDHLLAGTPPPISGHDHPHPFDDAAIVRAVALACALPTDPAALDAAVAADAAISNADDGVWCAQAIAAAVAALLAGAGAADAVDAAAARLPAGTWSALHLDRALRHAAVASDPLDLAWRLDGDVANAAYSYADAAPDVVAIALAILRSTYPRVEAGLLAASAVPRHAAGVVPLVGALFAAGGALPAPLPALIDRLPPLLGLALPRLRGVRLADLAARHPHEGT
jgi:hypothetical protein